MSETQTPSESKEPLDAGIQVDAYGIKGSFSPKNAAADVPTSWRDVLERLNEHAMRLADSLIGLPVDLVVGARNILRAIGGVRQTSRSAKKNAEEARNRASAKEESRQANPPAIADPDALPDALTALEIAILDLQAEGLHVEIRTLDDGSLGIIVVPPELAHLGGALLMEQDSGRSLISKPVNDAFVD